MRDGRVLLEEILMTASRLGLKAIDHLLLGVSVEEVCYDIDTIDPGTLLFIETLCISQQDFLPRLVRNLDQMKVLRCNHGRCPLLRVRIKEAELTKVLAFFESAEKLFCRLVLVINRKVETLNGKSVIFI